MTDKQDNKDYTVEEAEWLAEHPEMSDLSMLHDEMMEWMTRPISKHMPPRSDSG